MAVGEVLDGIGHHDLVVAHEVHAAGDLGGDRSHEQPDDAGGVRAAVHVVADMDEDAVVYRVRGQVGRDGVMEGYELIEAAVYVPYGVDADSRGQRAWRRLVLGHFRVLAGTAAEGRKDFFSGKKKQKTFHTRDRDRDASPA